MQRNGEGKVYAEGRVYAERMTEAGDGNLN